MSNVHPHWNAWYKTARWVKTARAQLRKEPFCRACAKLGIPVAAEVVDHVMPHHGNAVSFWFGPLQSLCKPCHDSGKRFEENRGFDNSIGADGYPLDARHPIYTGKLPEVSGEHAEPEVPPLIL